MSSDPRSILKFLAFSDYVLICAMLFMMQPVGVQASDISNKNASPDEDISQLKTRLKTFMWFATQRKAVTLLI